MHDYVENQETIKHMTYLYVKSYNSKLQAMSPIIANKIYLAGHKT